MICKDIPAHRDVRRPWNTPLPWFRVFFAGRAFGHVFELSWTLTASVHTLHMPKPVITCVFKVLRNGLLRENCSSRWMQPRPTCTLVAKKGKLRAKATKQIRWLGIQQANSAGPTFCWPQHDMPLRQLPTISRCDRLPGQSPHVAKEPPEQQIWRRSKTSAAFPKMVPVIV